MTTSRILRRILRGTDRAGGQVLVIFAGSLLVLMGMTALVVDVSWYWANTLRVQRAADAAALAGAVYLPGDVPTAYSRANQEAAKNGYSGGTGGVSVRPCQDTDSATPGCPTGGSNPRQLNVTISAPVSTFFMRVFGMSTINATRTAKAEFTLPVPMGSPENYYGVFGKLRSPGGGTTTYADEETGWINLATTKGTSTWTSPGSVYLSDNVRASSSTNLQAQQWGFTSGISFPASLDSFRGVEVDVEARTSGGTSCQVRADLSWNNGFSWTSGSGLKTVPATGLTTTDPAEPYYVMGGAADLWGRSSWASSDFSATNFRVRLTNLKPFACSGSTQVDYIRIKVYYRVSSFTPDANITDPYGQPLTPRGFWGTYISQGAEKINGDAYLSKWDPRTSRTNAEYDPVTYYNYAVKIPAGATNGELWIYDPVFCATDSNGEYGTGDRWFASGGTTNATSAFYTLYDMNNTPYDPNDDPLVASSGSLFANIRASDESLGGPDLGAAGASTDCSVGATANQGDGRYWHDRWWLLASGLQGGKTYRLHTRSTDPANPSAMDNANGHNSFSLWSKATGGTPQIHGLGAMEAFTPLAGGGAAEFYLAQIEAAHAGKTMQIRLWDPGDTGALSASLQILRPTATGYSPASFNYTAQQVASGAVSCGSRSGTGVTSVTTNSSGTMLFNGCWLTIEVPLPSDYDAATPPGMTQPGWWKIRYNMGGSASDTAFDLTTWQVSIRGNPVHLMP